MTITKPLKRRILAAILIYSVTLGSAYFWSAHSVTWATVGPILILATIGLGLLHLRWRAKEVRALTPEKIEDTFS